MNIIQIQPNESGSRPPIQTWNHATSPDGFAVVPADLDTSVFYEHNGFVTLTIEDSAVTGMEPNLEAWEAWKTSLPEPTPAPPTALEQLRADMDFIAIMTGVEL